MSLVDATHCQPPVNVLLFGASSQLDELIVAVPLAEGKFYSDLVQCTTVYSIRKVFVFTVSRLSHVQQEMTHPTQ
jgi:hypothetical protein